MDDLTDGYINPVFTYKRISPPVYEWKLELCHGTFWCVEKGKAPNWFHRKMQELLLGFKWRKIDE